MGHYIVATGLRAILAIIFLTTTSGVGFAASLESALASLARMSPDAEQHCRDVAATIQSSDEADLALEVVESRLSSLNDFLTLICLSGHSGIEDNGSDISFLHVEGFEVKLGCENDDRGGDVRICRNLALAGKNFSSISSSLGKGLSEGTITTLIAGLPISFDGPSALFPPSDNTAFNLREGFVALHNLLGAARRSNTHGNPAHISKIEAMAAAVDIWAVVSLSATCSPKTYLSEQRDELFRSCLVTATTRPSYSAPYFMEYPEAHALMQILGNTVAAIVDARRNLIGGNHSVYRMDAYFNERQLVYVEFQSEKMDVSEMEEWFAEFFPSE